MNPTISFLRKLILAFLNKLGSTDVEKSKINKKVQEEDKSTLEKKAVLKNWLKEEFIHPMLRDEKKIKYIPHRLKFTLNK